MSLLPKLIKGTLFRPFHMLESLLPTTPCIFHSDQVRYRYFKDRTKTWLVRRYGYEDKLDFRGPLPRIKESDYPLPKRSYMPPKAWHEKKALFGQNDYIDILGDKEGVTPIQFQNHIPAWLRGFQGNEYQMLIRKKHLKGDYIRGRPREWFYLNFRLKQLYRRLNYKTKSFMDKKSLRM